MSDDGFIKRNFEILPCGHKLCTDVPEDLLQDLHLFHGLPVDETRTQIKDAIISSREYHVRGDCVNDVRDSSIERRVSPDGVSKYFLLRSDGTDEEIGVGK